MKSGLERIWKEVGMTLLDISSQNVPGRNEENHEHLSQYS
jgi:hypothetical protein